MSIITLLLMVVAALAVAYFVAMSGQPVFAALNESTAGTVEGNHTYTAGADLKEYRLVKLVNPGDGHDRGVIHFDGTGVPFGVTLGCSDADEPVAIYVFGASHGSVKISTVEAGQAVTRFAKLVPAVDGQVVQEGSGGAVSAQVIGISLEANDNNHEVQISPSSLATIIG